MTQELAPVADNRIARASEPTMLDIIREASVDPRVDVDKLAALMGLQERVEARDAERAFNADLAAAMAEMPNVRKDGVKDMGTKGSIPYATYEHLDRIIRPIERRHGFCRIFITEPLEKAGTLMTCKLLHKGGHSISSTRFQPPDPGPGRNETQAIGSADSYARRYLTLAIWNIVTVGADDDANSVDVISDQQLSNITDMLNDLELPPARLAAFLKFAAAPSVERIKSRDYDRVMAELRRAKAAK
jgi:hypothetical protein